MRNVRRCLVGIMAIIALAGLQVIHGASDASAESGFCDPNSASYSPEAAADQCLDGILVTSTRNFVVPKCITEDRALEYGATYAPGECRPVDKTVQAEAVAQARAIAWFNHSGVRGAGPTTGDAVSPNIQWEPYIANDVSPRISYQRSGSTVTPKSIRPDILFYNHAARNTGESRAEMDVIEVKLDKLAGGGGVDDARSQRDAYIDLLRAKGVPAVAYPLPSSLQ